MAAGPVESVETSTEALERLHAELMEVSDVSEQRR
jgi:hypothetical protein